jgi:hypothetical protein
MVFMQSPQGDEIKEVPATTAALTPLMAAGWHQVPAPGQSMVTPKETKSHG